MKLSARDVLAGKVVQVTRGATTSHFRIDIGGNVVTASITNEAVDDLAPGAARATSSGRPSRSRPARATCGAAICSAPPGTATRFVFWWAELFLTAVGDGVVVALEHDGQPLREGEGPLALVSAADSGARGT